jgi:anti-sigma regulatory factor (Ser/Thr protein kinase)
MKRSRFVKSRAPLLRSMLFEPTAESVAAVRQFVGQCCADWGLEASSETAVLLASELATNAVRFSSSPVTVWLGRKPDRLVLSVEDGSPEPAVQRPSGPMAESGRGLHLVDALSERWGEHERADGKRVWAEIWTGADPA